MMALLMRVFVGLNHWRFTTEWTTPSVPFCWSRAMPLAAVAANCGAVEPRRSGLTESRQPAGSSAAARRPARTGNVVRVDMNLPRAVCATLVVLQGKVQARGSVAHRARIAANAPRECGACAAGYGGGASPPRLASRLHGPGGVPY